MLRGKKILVTGLTGQVAYPVAVAFAKDNEVWGIARFGDAGKRAALEQQGIRCVALDMEQGDYSSLPTDFDYVLNFAVFKGEAQSFDQDIRANAEGVGLLMSHCRKAKAFLHCSTTGVYENVGHEVITETSDLGDNHRVFMKTYSITKICTEAVVRFSAREFKLPTVICRLNVPYGDEGGWPYMHLQLIKNDSAIPVHPNKPNLFAPIHEDDIIASITPLLESATTPARIVNWAGNETVSIEEWSEYIGELVGKKVEFNYTESTIESVLTSNKELQKIAGPTKVRWQDGIRRMITKRHPDWLVK